jgi:hypothetical protein
MVAVRAGWPAAMTRAPRQTQQRSILSCFPPCGPAGLERRRRISCVLTGRYSSKMTVPSVVLGRAHPAEIKSPPGVTEACDPTGPETSRPRTAITHVAGTNSVAPSSHRGWFGQYFCISFRRAASGKSVGSATPAEPYPGLRIVLRRFAIEDELEAWPRTQTPSSRCIPAAQASRTGRSVSSGGSEANGKACADDTRVTAKAATTVCICIVDIQNRADKSHDNPASDAKS